MSHEGFEHDEEEAETRGLSRRELLRRGAVGAAAAGALPLLYTGAAGAAGGGLSAADIATIRASMGPINAKFSGKGEVWNIGAILPFSGAGSVYGIVQGNGVKVAAKHILAAGGPRVNVDFRDHASGDIVKGKNAILALEGKKISAVLSSYGGVIGAIIPDVGRKHILTLDPGGGNGNGLPPSSYKPYFWGARATPGSDPFPLIATFLKAKMPKVKKLGLMSPDVGPTTQATISIYKTLAAKYGLELSTAVTPRFGATDFSNELAALRAGNVDAVIANNYQNDSAYFLKQYLTAGIGKPVFNSEAYLAPVVKIAGGSYENTYIGADDFSVSSQNPWAKVLIKDARAMFGSYGVPNATPDFYTAGYYDATMVLWRLYMDVKQAGGNPHDGKALQDALLKRLTFPSVFGGGPGKVGSVTFDAKTHGLKHRPLALYQVKKGVPVRIVIGDRNGQGIKVLV